MDTIFIYAKDGKIKCLNLEESLKLGRNLVNDGYTHTHTLDSCAFIQYLHNDCEEIYLINEIKSLAHKS